jgi:Flp pilus assembly protein TadG
MRPARRSSREGHRDDGSLTAFVAVLASALFALIGLVVDGGRAVAAQSAAMGEAEQAARTGAEQISVASIRSGSMAIDPVQAILAARTYLRAAGWIGTVAVVGQTVSVRIVSSEPTVILGMIGLRQIGVSASASATSLHGVTRGDG